MKKIITTALIALPIVALMAFKGGEQTTSKKAAVKQTIAKKPIAKTVPAKTASAKEVISSANAATLTAKVQDGSTEFADCIVKYKSKWGEGNCSKCTSGTADTYVVYVKNTCNQKLDVVLAVQEESKSWTRTQWLGVAPNDTIRAYACKGTGKFLKWARVAGDNSFPFPTQQEINEQYK